MTTQIESWKELTEIFPVIEVFPVEINEFRSKEKLYGVDEAYAEMIHNHLVKPLVLHSKSLGAMVFSEGGKNELLQELQLCVMTVEPYSFIIGRLNGSFIVIDTHVIGQRL